MRLRLTAGGSYHGMNGREFGAATIALLVRHGLLSTGPGSAMSTAAGVRHMAAIERHEARAEAAIA